MKRRAFLQRLLKTHQGRILAHNLFACLTNGRLKPKARARDGRSVRAVVRALFKEAEARYASDEPARLWKGVECEAVQAVIDTIADRPRRWRFLGRELKDIDCHIALLITREKLLENTVAEVVNKDELARSGHSKDVPTTPALCRALVSSIQSGHLALKKGMLGSTFGVFWSARAESFDGPEEQRAIWPSLCAERAGLYHLSENKFKTFLFLVRSTKTLKQLAGTHKFRPKAPTPIEALQNFRFLAADVGPGKADWGFALNMAAFRYQLNLVKQEDLAGMQEVALPPIKFKGNFELEFFGDLPETLVGTDERYRRILDRVFRPVTVQRLASVL